MNNLLTPWAKITYLIKIVIEKLVLTPSYEAKFENESRISKIRIGTLFIKADEMLRAYVMTYNLVTSPYD